MENDDPKPRGPRRKKETRTSRDPFIDEALDWFVRLQANPGDRTTARLFREWTDGDPRRAAAFEKVAAMWGAPEFLRATDNVAKATGSPAKGHKKKKPSSSSKRAKRIVGASAIVLLLWSAANAPDLLIWMRADYTTTTGERRVIALPDGSTMILNTSSAAALDYRSERRTVTLLEGEAYFDVVSDSGRPFRVDGAYSVVEVKGTAFAVRMDEGADDVILSRGTVDVSRLDSVVSKHVELQPGQAVNVTSTAIAAVRQVDPETALAWVDGRISFHDRPFGEILAQLRRYHRGRVMVLNSQIEKIPVSGNYRLDEPAGAIRSLAEAAGATVTTLPGGILILR